MRNINIAKNIQLFNLIYFLIYNIYFGFNWESQSVAESNCDTIFKAVLYVAFIIYLLPLFKLYEKAVELFLTRDPKSE